MAKDSLSLWGSATFQTLNLFFSSNKFLLPLIKPLMNRAGTVCTHPAL